MMLSSELSVSPASNVIDRPGRTRAHPAEELNSVLSSYCSDGADLNASAVRAIGTAVTKLADSGMLHMADSDQIYHFLKIGNDSVNGDDFPFDVAEIMLKILAEPEMPLKLYNDDWIQNIINKLHNICSELFQNPEKKTQIHKLFPFYRHLAHIVQQIHISDSSLYNLIGMSLPAYFHQASSPSLQTTSCALITAIFKKYATLRNDIINEIFSTVEKNQGSPKYVTFPNDERKPISAISRIFLELIQSISSFPCDTESIIQDSIKYILQYFTKRSRGIASMNRIYEKFIEDICICMSHPFYPGAKLFLKSAIESFFPSITQKDINTKIAIKLLCLCLTNILKCSKRGKEEIAVVYPTQTLKLLSGYNDEMINSYVEEANSHIRLIDNENCAMKIDENFPSNQLEEIASHFIIALYLKQSNRLSEVIDTSLPFSITLWSEKTLSKEEMDNYLLWWRGMIPTNINFEWTLEIAERICLHELCQQPMITHVHLLVQHLLRGLENKSSSVRSQILRGLSSIIEIDPNLLFHPSLVANIKEAFQDPSPPIRDSVLQILSKFIFQNEQSSSPYFSVVINCLADPSPMVVKTALSTVGQLSKASNSDDKSLSRLCFLLSTKINDESNNVAKTAREAFIQVLFDDAENPTQILINVLNETHVETNKRPAWFSKFFKQLYLKPKFTQRIKDIIFKSFEIANETPTFQTISLVYEFCESFPKICAPQYEILISLFNICTDDSTLSILPNAINAIIKDISNPSITMFTLMMKSIENYIYTKSSLIIRFMVQLASNIIPDILPSSDMLSRIFNMFVKYLRETLGKLQKQIQQNDASQSEEVSKQISNVCRAIFTCGCICRYYKEITPRHVKQIWGPINFYFNIPVPRIRSMVLQAVCDICTKNLNLINDTIALVNNAFNLGPPESVSGVVFLKCLIEEESKTESDAALDEIRPMNSSDLIKRFINKIKENFFSEDSAMRSAILELTRVALSHGVINPPDVIQFVIAMLCSKEQSAFAIETLKEIIYNL